ncbi:hypothetical protein BDV32DRAFT_116913 [Aspergillus pseudonomiae]|uniref:Uncharacterized protein n=1 Tax=Aspergillus pseudonomiae TaxID=1506151 RepID=A0A5N7DM17_9EURO|nr:uncharacterized protein BDV37DRAFT_17510 [Aspergillus pseudonomiae]KAB8264985.1 hypothetical protein BDV32DRAFT_116913 [Aspergillus pseudonomiae]KAE8407355.1 hypothetical protein BDV37DRAFT_17510 [Aspergillus pseudonomiae]
MLNGGLYIIYTCHPLMEQSCDTFDIYITRHQKHRPIGALTVSVKMALGKRSRSLQRPQTDYERWLEEHNENYQPGQDAQYHPPIPGNNGQVPVYHREIDDSPRQRANNAHPTHSDITHLQSYKPHGEFLRQVGAGPPSALGGALADSFRGHCPYQLALFFVVVIALLQIARSLEKRRRRAIAPSTPGSIKSVNLHTDEKVPV